MGNRYLCVTISCVRASFPRVESTVRREGEQRRRMEDEKGWDREKERCVGWGWGAVV